MANLENKNKPPLKTKSNNCLFLENLNHIAEELSFLHQIAEHLDKHIQTLKSCSQGGGCCQEMKQISRHSREAHAQIHDLLEHLNDLKKLLETCSDKNKISNNVSSEGE